MKQKGSKPLTRICENGPTRPSFMEVVIHICIKVWRNSGTNIGYTTTMKRISANTLQGQSPNSLSTKPLSGSGITALYHSNGVYMADHKECMADSAWCMMSAGFATLQKLWW